MPEKELTVAVISDLHAYNSKECPQDEPRKSFLDMARGESDSEHPVCALNKLIREKNLGADLLIAAGDLGYQAQPASVQYGWKMVNEISIALGKAYTIAVPGNHDFDSRSKYNDHDTKAILQGLSPAFPFHGDELQNDRFWARHYCITQVAGFRIVLVDSSAFHGINDEKGHGRISKYTIQKLNEELDLGGRHKANILVCHHHPQRMEGLNHVDYEVMKGGETLLNLIGTGRYGDWFVIHGHKHVPRISYAAGSNSSAIVFSAGSLCCCLYPEIQYLRNQFYLIDFTTEETNHYGLLGKIRAWDWSSGLGWTEADDSSGLPAISGFGFREKPFYLANKIASSSSSALLKKGDLQAIEPQIQFLIPDDIKILKQCLESQFSLNVTLSKGMIEQVGRPHE